MPDLTDADLKSNAFVRAALDHFKDKMLKYHALAITTEERRNRALAIGAALATIRFEDGGQVFTLAPVVTETVIEGVVTKGYQCTDPNEKCCCGTTCIPISETCPDCPPPPPAE